MIFTKIIAYMAYIKGCFSDHMYTHRLRKKQEKYRAHRVCYWCEIDCSDLSGEDLNNYNKPGKKGGILCPKHYQDFNMAED